ncbi:MAG: phosphatidate cytidylyltransferase [Hyphomicrobiaceae bacterium]
MALQIDSSELVARLLSATVLILISLACLWAGTFPFAVLVAVLGVAMCWEWGCAVRAQSVDSSFVLHAATAVVASLGTVLAGPLIALTVVAAGSGALAIINLGKSGFWSGIGALYVGLPAIGLVWMRNDVELGAIAVLFILCIVWAHDTFAMMVGRTVGGPRLWPRLTPNKTWSGAIGGLAASVIAGIVFAQFLATASGWQLAGTGLALGLAGFAGDLVESAFKRVHGLKNASNLIPGHGGVLDRLDGVVAATLLSTLMAILINPDWPARALLYLN